MMMMLFVCLLVFIILGVHIALLMLFHHFLAIFIIMQSQEKVSESINRGYIFQVILGDSFFAFGACVLGFSIVNFGAGTERTMDNIAKSLDELVQSSNDFLSIIR